MRGSTLNQLVFHQVINPMASGLTSSGLEEERRRLRLAAGFRRGVARGVAGAAAAVAALVRAPSSSPERSPSPRTAKHSSILSLSSCTRVCAHKEKLIKYKIHMVSLEGIS